MFASGLVTFLLIFAVHIKAQSHPTNIILLGIWTIFESIFVGSAVVFRDEKVVLQAFVITTLVFLGLTLFTLQSKYDFSSMGTYLFVLLLAVVVTSIVGFFVTWSRTFDIFFAGAGCLLFCGYILYDTYMIANRFSPDDWVLAVMALYLDVINLFFFILRLLSDLQDR
ncbi:transmembrane BAX inhibitor motif containing 4 [Atractiella rhizophila]|nr:transmembrane BAX inhibitor motif containing 4 [Atractiella rhizophila]